MNAGAIGRWSDRRPRRRAAIPGGKGTMRPRGHLRKPAIFSRRLLSIVVRSVAIASMSFAVAFGFLSGATSPGGALRSPYVRHRRVGAVRRRLRRHRHPHFAHPPDEDRAARHGNASRRGGGSQLGNREAQERTKSFLEAQGDVIVRRGSAGAITYANDAFCALAGRAREDLLATAFALAGLKNRAKPRCSPTARASTTRRSPRPQARAGSPGARSRCGPAPAARRRASAAT